MKAKKEVVGEVSQIKIKLQLTKLIALKKMKKKRIILKKRKKMKKMKIPWINLGKRMLVNKMI